MGKCRDKFEEETDVKRKAILSQKYLAVLFFTEIPPQRGKEYQSMVLRVCRKGKLPAPGTDSRHAPNCLYIAEDGSEGYIKISDYKTKKTHGEDYILLTDAPILFTHLYHHLSVHRDELVQDSSVKNLFVVRKKYIV